MTELIFQRSKEFLPYPLEILVDGEERGLVKNGKTFRLTLQPGNYNLQLRQRVNLYSEAWEFLFLGKRISPPLPVTVNDREVQHYQCCVAEKPWLAGLVEAGPLILPLGWLLLSMFIFNFRLPVEGAFYLILGAFAVTRYSTRFSFIRPTVTPIPEDLLRQ